MSRPDEPTHHAPLGLVLSASDGEQVAYYWSAIPDEVTIRCPRCARAASFVSARWVYAHTHLERERLAEIPGVELVWITDRDQRRCVALHDPPLVTGTPPFEGRSLRCCPPGIERERGSFRCDACCARGKHRLDWPGDAFFAWDIRGELLWAYSRAHAIALRELVAGSDRDPARYGEFEWFLRHVPSRFLEAKLRDTVIKRIDRSLAGG